MELPSFVHYCQDLADSKPESFFFRSSETILSYKKLLANALALSLKLESLNEKFLALKLSRPDVVFTYLLAALMSGKKILLLSHLEPFDQTLRHNHHIPFELIIDDQHPWNQLAAKEHIPQIEFKTSFDEAFLFVLSSGSSGEPNGIGHSLSTITYSALSVIRALSMKEGEITCLGIPHSHVGGLMCLWRAFFSKGIIDTTAQRCDYLSIVPLQLERGLRDPKTLEKWQKTKAVLIGGGTLSDDLKKKAQVNLIPFYETYGMSETCSLVMLNGQALEGQEVILDQDNTILIKGPTLAPGRYKNRVFHTLELNKEGFYQTPDQGEMASDGTITFTQRRDILFKSGGELINPVIIENTTREIPWINDCVVVPVPHAKWGQAACLLYEKTRETKAGDDEQILSFLKTKLHPYLIPKYIFAHSFASSGLKLGRHHLKSKAYQKLLERIFSFDFFASSEKQKNILVFFHGFMGDKLDFKKIFELMKKSPSTSYLFLDLPGHGETNIEHFYNREDAFIKLKDFLSLFLQDSSLCFYGYSMGGRIALELALNYLPPEKLILESASFGLASVEEKAQRLKSDEQLFSKPNFDTKKFLLFWYDTPLFVGYNQTTGFLADLEKKSEHDWRQWQKSLDFFSQGKGMLLSETIGKIKGSSFSLTVISGARDKKYQEHFTNIQKELSFNRFNIEGASHNPHKTRPAEIAKIVN